MIATTQVAFADGNTTSLPVIDNDGELNIETTGTVTLKQGTVIKPGGKLSIKHIKQ